MVSFALILHDPDTSLNKTTEEVLHWMVFNIPGTARELPEGMPAQAQMADALLVAEPLAAAQQIEAYHQTAASQPASQ